MPVTGTPGTSTYLHVNRDRLIYLAYGLIGKVEEEQNLTGEQLEIGKDVLTLLVRQTDHAGRWRWTIEEASHVPLVANVYSYTADNGLPSNIAEPLTATFRDANGKDTPIDILKAEMWEKIVDKTLAGVPKYVYITDVADITLRTMYTWPTVSAAATQSLINGYRCIRSHTSSPTSEPVSGPNWRVFWEPGGEGADLWATETAYTAPPQIRLLYRRPLVDFVTPNDTPDFPLQWPRLLLYQLAHDLGDFYGIPLEERKLLIAKAKGAADDIFPSMKAKSTTIHNKAKYF
jgi:hypothetical protein